MKITTDEELQWSHEYIAVMEKVVLEMRRTHTPEQFAFFSSGWLRHIEEAQADIVEYLRQPESVVANRAEAQPV